MTKAEHAVKKERDFMARQALDSAAAAMAFWSGDWSLNHRLAWVWGIIIGWDDDSIAELAEKFDWTAEAVSKLKEYRASLCTQISDGSDDDMLSRAMSILGTAKCPSGSAMEDDRRALLREWAGE